MPFLADFSVGTECVELKMGTENDRDGGRRFSIRKEILQALH